MRRIWKAWCRPLAASKWAAFGMLALGLSGCGHGSIAGNGVRPDHIVITLANSSTVQLAPATIYQCRLGSLRALMYFSDGSIGDFTNRVVWSSDGPGVAQVSNADIQSDTGFGFYARGTLLPGDAGHTTIEANYQGIIGHFDVNVASPDANSYQIVSGANTSPSFLTPPVLHDGALWLGVGTLYPLRVLDSEGGILKDVSGSAIWGFPQGDPAVVSVSGTGILVASQQGATQSLQVTFPGCQTVLTLPVTVANITHISVLPTVPQNFGNAAALPPGVSPANELMVGNTERLTVVADFGSDPASHYVLNDSQNKPIEQDISGLVNFFISDPTVFTAAASGVGGIAVLTAEAPGAVTLFATTSFGGQAMLTSDNVQFSAVSGILQSISVAPEAPDSSDVFDPLAGLLSTCASNVTVAPDPVLLSGSICYFPFKAQGAYLVLDDPNPTDSSTPCGSSLCAVQDISGAVSWSLSVDSTPPPSNPPTLPPPPLATIGGGALGGGQVNAPTAQEGGVLTVTATVAGTTVDLSGTSSIQIR